LQSQCQFGSIDCCPVSLRNEQLVRLETARCSVRLLSYVEDYGMSVKLRRGVAINGPSRVVFKSSGNELASSLWGVHIPNARLRVSL
jgi:hypothetical protein